MKIKAKTIRDFAKEIHSSETHSNIKSYKEIETITENWLKERVFIDIKRSYQSIVDRGLIAEETTFTDWMDALKSEVSELDLEQGKHQRIKEELADVIIVATNMAFHYKIDITEAIEDKILINEKRALNETTKRQNAKTTQELRRKKKEQAERNNN